jgi:hypothetical protein
VSMVNINFYAHFLYGATREEYHYHKNESRLRSGQVIKSGRSLSNNTCLRLAGPVELYFCPGICVTANLPWPAE